MKENKKSEMNPNDPGPYKAKGLIYPMKKMDALYYKCRKGNCANLIDDNCIVENPDVISISATHGSGSMIVSCKSFKLN